MASKNWRAYCLLKAEEFKLLSTANKTAAAADAMDPHTEEAEKQARSRKSLEYADLYAKLSKTYEKMAEEE